MFLFSKKSNIRYGVVFEVGSGSVAGAIISVNSYTGDPIILYNTREFLALKQTKINEDITRRLLSLFVSMALDVEAKISQFIPSSASIAVVHINFTAPWSYTKCHQYTYTSEEPMVVTSKVLAELQTAATEQISTEEPMVDVLLDKGITIIDRTVIGYSANNYPITNPVGQTIKTLTITETISAITNTIFVPAEDMIKKLFPDTPLVSSTSTLIQQSIFQTQGDMPTRFASIHLTYEALELCLYQDKAVTATFTVDIGVNTIARNIAQVSKIPHEQVLAFLLTEDATPYQDDFRKKIQDAFDDTALSELNIFFSKVHSAEFLPSAFYLITPKSPTPILSHYINQILKKITKNRYTLQDQAMPVVKDNDVINSKQSSTDSNIATLAHFFHKTIKND